MTRHSISFAKLALVLAAPLAFALAGCGGSNEEPEEKPKNGDKPTDPDSVRIEEFTGGHTKMVWSKHVGGGSTDVHLSYTKHQLWGIDTRDGKGIRQVVEVTNNYGRPLITPGGESIVWTNKGTEDAGLDDEGKRLKKFNPVMFRAFWDGSKSKKLGEGYAVDVWRDPETGIDWVYAAVLGTTNRASLYADKLERFPIDQPKRRELVWDKTRLSTENIQLSQDGKRASALFPWPDAGVIDLENDDNVINSIGCWPALAPDNSYKSWVFDGAHKNLRMFDAEGEKLGQVAINNGPEMGGHEVYHPRWSNHVEFMTVTGPYTGVTVSKSPSKGIEVYIGKFNEGFSGIENWLKVTENEEADFFPDLWVAHGVTGENNIAQAAGGSGAPKKKKRAWPMTGGRLLFLWENRTTPNIVDGKGRVSKVEAREQARFGRHFDMLCDGGYFEADAETSAAVEAHLGLHRFKFTLEALVTPFSSDQEGAIISTKAFQVQQRGDEIILVSTRPTPQALWIGKAEAGVTAHFGVLFNGLEFLIYHNGKLVSQEGHDPQPDMLATRAGLTFGEGWDGALEGVSLVPGEIDDWRLERGAQYLMAKLEDRKPVERIRLKAKLIEMTPDVPVAALDTYQRALLGYLYEVEEVLEGEYDEDKVVVMHWTILDRQPLQGFPRRPGQSYELLLEPFNEQAHPELISERQWNDILELLPPWYDVATPED